MLKKDLSLAGDLTQDMCARTLECKSKEANRFKWVFIPTIKNDRVGFPAHKVKEVPTIKLPSHC